MSAAAAGYAGATPSEQAPILCSRCGGLADSDAQFRVRCRFCGNVEQLPADALGRTLELKRRLAAAGQGAAQLDGTQAALARIFEDRGAYLRVTGIYLAFFAFVSVYAVVNVWGAVDKAPANVVPMIVVSALSGPLMIGGLCVSMGLALAVGRLQYRRSIRPQLLARPPLTPGAPMRCRGCGADLPAQRDAIVRCAYCGTSSVVSNDTLAHASQLLMKEEQDLRARSMGAVNRTATASIHMRRTAILCFVATYVVIFGLIKVVEIATAP